jgi:hypothetical protein
MARAFTPQIATGNALLEGDVIYFTYDGTWSRAIGDAAIALNAEAAATLLKNAQGHPDVAVGIYLAEVAIDDRGRAAPAHFREAFRTRGPSNYPWLGKQAERHDV